VEASDLKRVELSLVILALWALIFTGAQARVVAIESRVQQGQLTAAAERLAAVKKVRDETSQAISEREKQIADGQQQEVRYAALLTALLELAKEDPDARLIVQKWKIQSNAEAPTAPQSAVEAPGASAERVGKPTPSHAVSTKTKSP
jgi:hypothetical protein